MFFHLYGNNVWIFITIKVKGKKEWTLCLGARFKKKGFVEQPMKNELEYNTALNSY